MQRYGQLHLQPLIRELPDAGHDAAGADGDAPRADVESVGVVQEAHGFQGRVVVVERLAHAHVDDVVRPLPQRRRKAVDLRDDFPGGKVAGITALGAGAERAAHAAAGLGGHAYRVPVPRGNQDRFDPLAVRQFQQPFTRAARIAGFVQRPHGRRRMGRRQGVLQGLRQVAHPVPGIRMADLHPLPELAPAEGRLTGLPAQRFQFFGKQALESGGHGNREIKSGAHDAPRGFRRTGKAPPPPQYR